MGAPGRLPAGGVAPLGLVLVAALLLCCSPPAPSATLHSSPSPSLRLPSSVGTPTVLPVGHSAAAGRVAAAWGRPAAASIAAGGGGAGVSGPRSVAPDSVAAVVLFLAGAALTAVAVVECLRPPPATRPSMAAAAQAGLVAHAALSVALEVQPQDGRTRLDQFLARRLPGGVSRSRVQRALAAGAVQVNGAAATKAAAKLTPGDRVLFQDAENEFPSAVQAEDTPLHVYFEDAAVLVVEKPAGLPVHPSKGQRSGTLVNALLHHVGRGPPGTGMGCLEADPVEVGGGASDCESDSDLDSPAVSDAPEGEEPAGKPPWGNAGLLDPVALTAPLVRPGIVHRLDKGTSGVLVVAKTAAAHHVLTTQFAARTVQRSYLAFLWGVPSPPLGKVETHLGRDPSHPLRMAVLPEGAGRYAATTYRVLESFLGGRVALVQFKLHTGRTHQIRVHALHLGHPVVGDPVYARPPSGPPLLPALHTLGRPALHAHTLGFLHPDPADGRRLSFTSPLPPDLAHLLGELRALQPTP